MIVYSGSVQSISGIDCWLTLYNGSLTGSSPPPPSIILLQRLGKPSRSKPNEFLEKFQFVYSNCPCVLNPWGGWMGSAVYETKS